MSARVRRRGDPSELTSEPDLGRLYDEFHPFVRGALRKHYVDPNDLEDMTQEVFLVLLRRVDEATRTRSLGAWLYQIARRVAANQHRTDRRRVRKHDELSADADTSARDTTDPQERLARADAWAFVRDFLESLDAEACAVFVMSEIEGLRGAEIAARLHLSLPMTYARIRMVRERFARRVARERRGMLAGLWWANDRPALAVLALALTTSRRLKLAALAILVVLVGLFTLRGGRGDGAPEGGTSADVGERSDEHERHAAQVGDAEADSVRRASAATGVFAGLVVDLAGAPISNAIVCGDRANAPDHPLTSPPACTRSDARGRFRIDGTLLQAHTLEAMAKGFVPGRFHGRPTHDVRIVLHPGGVELSGIVADVHGGPIEGAWVAIENRSEATLGATVATDDAGAFSLWVAEGPVSLAAGASGYASSFHPALAPAQGVHIELGAESVIAGIVVDGETGEPVADVRISALLQEGDERYSNRGGVAFSGAEGRWEIHGLSPDHYLLDAAGDHGWGRAEEAIDLGIGDARDDIRIELIAGTEIVGRIVDAETGAGCSDGYAITIDQTQNITREDRTDGEGWVAVRPLSGGAVYRITVTCRGYESREVEVDLRAGPVEKAEWALARGGELVVRIVDDARKPLRDWSVQLATPLDREAYLDPGMRRVTDTEGTVVFTGVTVGDYRVIAQGPGHPPIKETRVAVGHARTTIELEAEVGVAITGTVVDAAGKPVRGALVALQRPGRGRRFPQAYWSTHVEVDVTAANGPYHAVTDAAGKFRHASVGAGEYGVWVLPEGAAVPFQRPGEFPPGVVARVPREPQRSITVANRPIALALRMGTLSSISGIVRGEDGDVVMDARVFAVREHEGDVTDPRGRPRLTDREGRYTIDDLEEGEYTLVAYRPGGGVARRKGVASGSHTADLELPKVGRISGTVRAFDGSVVKGFGLHVHGGRHDDRAPLPVGSNHGRFAVGDLEAGHYSLWVIAPEGEGRTEVDLDEGEQRSGVVITLGRRAASVHGRLIDGSGAPAEGWLVALREAGVGDDRRFELGWVAKSAEDGSFTIRDLVPLTFAIVALPEGHDVFDPMQGGWPVYEATELRVVTVNDGEAIDVGDVTIPEDAR